MVQLIITVLAIALASASVLVTVSYAPWWTQIVAETDVTLRASIRKIESAYIATARATSLAAMEPTGATDGGLMNILGASLGFTPAGPSGYTWVYGKGGGAGAYANVHYVCLTPDGTLSARDESVARALERAARGFSPEQFIVATSCGAVASEDVSSDVPVLTYYLKPVPDVGL